jgi:hypothetical protein
VLEFREISFGQYPGELIDCVVVVAVLIQHLQSVKDVDHEVTEVSGSWVVLVNVVVVLANL